ncbi:nucleotide-diphospho-sugar transferase [Trametes meyenii]|nr:nucleotide-diphospho-sugar transferase [Trametes meyenii]
MPPYRARSTRFRTIIQRLRQPATWLQLLFCLSLTWNVVLSRKKAKVITIKEEIRTPLDNYQHLHHHSLINEAYLQSLPQHPSENAIVTSMYNDAFAVPIATLGHSLNKANSTARRIVFYLPGSVSQRALCIASMSGFEPYAVDRVEPPSDGGVHSHFIDQFTKLRIWTFADLGLKAVVYLDADTLVRRNFDELFALPFNFAAVPDVYVGDPGFTIGFNAGVLFVRPDSAKFRDLVAHINTAGYSHWEAEQAFLNVFYGADTVRLPYAYNGNIAIKKRNPRLWQGLQDELRLVHFSLVKPFWREVYDEIGIDYMHDNVKLRAGDWDGVFREEILEWGQVWGETERKYAHEIMKCGWKHGVEKPRTTKVQQDRR